MKEFSIEIETELLDKVRVVAEREGRTLDEQICFFIQQYLQKPEIKKELEARQHQARNQSSE